MSQGRAWCFTLNNPSKDIDYGLPDLRFCVHQLEQGEGGTYHWQGYAEFLKPKRLAALRQWIEGAHWELRRGTGEQAAAYCTKEETRIAGPWLHGHQSTGQGQRIDLESYRSDILRGASDEELLENHLTTVARFPKLASTIRRARSAASAAKITIANPTPWQQKAIDIANATPDIREVHWFVDLLGNSGKTHLCRHMINNFGAFYSVGGKHADVLYAYEGQSVVCFDFPRSAEEFVCYSVIEALKNGVVTISKYESRTFLFPVPTVLVFSNFEPDRSKLSADRWKVTNICQL